MTLVKVFLIFGLFFLLYGAYLSVLLRDADPRPEPGGKLTLWQEHFLGTQVRTARVITKFMLRLGLVLMCVGAILGVLQLW